MDLVHDEEEDDDPVRRRRFIGLTGAALFNAALAEPGSGGWAMEDIATALTDSSIAGNERPVGLSQLASSVASAKTEYQACRYVDVSRALPRLLRQISIAGEGLRGGDLLRLQALSAEAHHVAASILLKHEDRGLAWLAAERSMQASRATESPLMIGSSSRILTHALMSEGHNRAATDVATKAAQNMSTDIDMSVDDDLLSVYGSLLLRGAIAAAQLGNRHAVATLLDEADDAGRRLGRDDNRMWTAFGPTNVLLHRVSTSLTLGDAGAAISAARKIDLDKVLIKERKAVLLTHTSQAFLQWGKHDRAFHVLRSAHQLAPEEITSRPATQRLLRDMATLAPSSMRGEIQDFATAIGVRV